jgi:DNA-binding transcriptional ArsR family regulator
MQDENQSKLLKFSLANKKIAVAVLGQAILDEGGIGASGISIFYTYKEEALHLWKIADSLGYANPFRKKKHRNHHHYGFGIKASKVRELYARIGPLPNPVKDMVIRHLANRRPNINLRATGGTKKLMLQLLRQKPMTVLQLMLRLGVGASTTRRQLRNLRKQGLVEISGRYQEAFERSRRTAHLWKAT